ncbi:hypothetical protein L596_009980 [Steinernema carpocapsae]|uniref:BRCT domain-containing protein n=1 Tax=Steinernema carpocapsae TaxID=34508 RepID=A0A4U5PH55_STECR|nr:hypothetical protein L596_009980 [Steinernema carpocapsae]
MNVATGSLIVCLDTRLILIERPYIFDHFQVAERWPHLQTSPRTSQAIIYVLDVRTLSDVEATDEDHEDAGLTFKVIFDAESTERRSSGNVREGGRLPKVDHPVYSATLSDAVITVTGYKTKEREDLKTKIQWMNGRFTGDFLGNVTHLIADQCNPEATKYKEAMKIGIPVVSAVWIDEAWRQVTKERCTVMMTLKEVIDKFKLPIFAGMVVTVSGLGVDSRSELSRLIVFHGGEFTCDMKRGKCTHLVTDKNVGEKVKRAKEWGTVKIVATKWIRRCVEKGIRIPEKLYSPMTKTRSTMGGSQTTSPDADVSFVPNHSFCLTPNTSFSVSRVPETPGLSKTLENLNQMTKECLIQKKLSGTEKTNLAKLHKKLSTVDPIENVDVKELGTFNNCLAGCGILLCGISEENVPKWRRILNITGASRCQIPDIDSARLTQIILGPEPVEEVLLSKIKNRSNVVPIVTPEWLLQSAQQRFKRPQQDFFHPLFDAERKALMTQNRPDEAKKRKIC